MNKYLIEVKGEIIAMTGIHYAQSWACRSISLPVTNNDYSYEKETHTVNSNLVLTENIRAVPYAIYYTNKGIVEKSTGSMAFYKGYGAAYEYYKENIKKISYLLKHHIPKELEQIVFHGLFTDVFSILELFLSDLILCMIYSDEAIYEKAVLYYITSKGTQNKASEIEKKVHNLFFTEIVYHKFDTVKKIYRQLLDIQFPNTEELRKFLHKRNNIVHRFSFSNIDRMRVIEITVEDIENLIKEANSLANQLIENISKR